MPDMPLMKRAVRIPTVEGSGAHRRVPFKGQTTTSQATGLPSGCK